jgi:hypothetical protein
MLSTCCDDVYICCWRCLPCLTCFYHFVWRLISFVFHYVYRVLTIVHNCLTMFTIQFYDCFTICWRCVTTLFDDVYDDNFVKHVSTMCTSCFDACFITLLEDVYMPFLTIVTMLRISINSCLVAVFICFSISINSIQYQYASYLASVLIVCRRLLNMVGYSTSSVTQHRRWLDIVNLVHNRNKEANWENPVFLDLTDY